MCGSPALGSRSIMSAEQSARVSTKNKSVWGGGVWLGALVIGFSLGTTQALAAPLVFEETTRILSPDPTYRFPTSVAVEGDTIFAGGVRFDGEIQHNAVFLFRRQSSGAWTYVRTLATSSCSSGELGEDTCNTAVAVRNGLAVVAADTVQVLTRAADGNWVAAPTTGSSGPGYAAVGTDAVVVGEAASCDFSARVFRRNASGVWTAAATLPGPSFPGCDSWGMIGSRLDMSAGNRVIVGNSAFTEDAQIFEPSSGTWIQTRSLTGPERFAFGGAVAIDDNRALASGSIHTPIHVYSRTGGWVHSADIVPPNAVEHGPPTSIQVRNLVVASFPGDPHRGGSVGVYQETSPGTYDQVARLVASDSGPTPQYIGNQVAAYVSGAFARIAATSQNALYVFDLNRWGTTPAPLQETFESGNSANWTPMAGSSFSVATSTGSRVFRQSSLAGDAGAFVTSIDWTNQAIEADVRPTAFGGTNRWVGLAVRRTDANNYYYVTLRQTNMLELKRNLNGVFVTLASKAMPVVLNRNYRLRLEASGTLLRVYVNGDLQLQAHDSTFKRGHAGVRMWQARADFDNVILSQNPQLTILDIDTYRPQLTDRWVLGPGAWSDAIVNEKQRIIQQDLTGDARAATRTSANNQIVQARVTATTFESSAGGRWFGLMARYADAGNYYYVTLRRDNTVSLRKLVNGAIHILDSAPFTVAVGTPYTVRLEAVGSALRAYVNGNLLLEANDTSHARGKYGPVMYKTAATYDDFLAWEP